MHNSTFANTLTRELRNILKKFGSSYMRVEVSWIILEESYEIPPQDLSSEHIYFWLNCKIENSRGANYNFHKTNLTWDRILFETKSKIIEIAFYLITPLFYGIWVSEKAEKNARMHNKFLNDLIFLC